MGITLITKEITPKNISIEMKFNIGMMCLQKEGRDVRLLSL